MKHKHWKAEDWQNLSVVIVYSIVFSVVIITIAFNMLTR